MKQYTVYNASKQVLLHTFDEDKAWEMFNPDAGHTIDESVDDDGGYDEYKEGDTNLAFKYQ